MYWNAILCFEKIEKTIANIDFIKNVMHIIGTPIEAIKIYVSQTYDSGGMVIGKVSFVYGTYCDWFCWNLNNNFLYCYALLHSVVSSKSSCKDIYIRALILLSLLYIKMMIVILYRMRKDDIIVLFCFVCILIGLEWFVLRFRLLFVCLWVLFDFSFVIIKKYLMVC